MCGSVFLLGYALKLAETVDWNSYKSLKKMEERKNESMGKKKEKMKEKWKTEKQAWK